MPKSLGDEVFWERLEKFAPGRYRPYDGPEGKFRNVISKVRVVCNEHPDEEVYVIPQNVRKGCGGCRHADHKKDSSSRKNKRGLISLAEAYPEIAAQWNHEANGTLTPHTISKASNKLVHWKCIEGHEYVAQVYNRTIGGGNCPFCSGRRVTKKNSLKNRYPEIAAEWSNKNSRSVEEYSYCGSKKAWWCCSKGHEWEATIYNRTVRGDGCPACQPLFHSKVAIRWLCAISEKYNIKIQHAENGGEYRILLPEGKKPIRLDGYDSAAMTVYEFFGTFWHGDPRVHGAEEMNEVTGTTFGKLYVNTLERVKKLELLGYRVIYVWERDYHSGIEKSYETPPRSPNIMEKACNITDLHLNETTLSDVHDDREEDVPCEKGWFGPEEDYEEYEEVPCEKGWFGPEEGDEPEEDETALDRWILSLTKK